MKKIKRILIFAFSLVIILTAAASIAFAHSGRLDSNGGHYNRSTGEYHYHNGTHSTQSDASDYESDNDNDYNYTDNDYTNSYFDETTTRNYYSSEDDKATRRDADSMNNGLLIFLIVLSFIILAVLIVIMLKLSSIENTDSKRLYRVEQNNEKILNSIKELSNNNLDYAHGYDEGFERSTSRLTPQLIEKAYQMGIRDADKVKEERERIREMFRQGIKVDLEIDTAESTYEYVEADNTIQTEPFVSIGQTLEEALRVPNGIKITDDLKLIDTKYPNEKFGRYTVYSSTKGTKLHLKRGCCSATNAELSFAYKDISYFHICSKCFNSNTDKSIFFIPEWYKDFRAYKKKVCFDKNSPYYNINGISDYEHDFRNCTETQ